jgi:hypothetical protein
MFFFFHVTPFSLSLSLLSSPHAKGGHGPGIGHFETRTHTLRVVKTLYVARLQCVVSVESLVGRGGYFDHGWINIVIH